MADFNPDTKAPTAGINFAKHAILPAGTRIRIVIDDEIGDPALDKTIPTTVTIDGSVYDVTGSETSLILTGMLNITPQ